MLNKNKAVIIAAAMASSAHVNFSFADPNHNTIPYGAENHAPIGVMADHAHKKNEVMMSYRYMNMTMDELYEGNKALTNGDLDSNYAMVPVDMTMEMHMVGAMYATSDDVTWMVMAPYLRNEMTMTANPNAQMAGGMSGMGSMSTPMTNTGISEGIGDIKLSAIMPINTDENESAVVNLGFSIPTGSIEEKSASGKAMGYGMQLGSGTYDALLSVTWSQYNAWANLGAQARATIRLEEENEQGYRLGNQYLASAWIAKGWSTELSTSIRLQAKQINAIAGQYEGMMPMSICKDADTFGGTYGSMLVGINYLFTGGPVKGTRLAVEYEQNLFADTFGPQMITSEQFTLGWQLAW